MEDSSRILKALLFLTFSVHPSSAVTHSLQYLYTAITPGINFPEVTPVGLVDGEQFVSYDSNIKKLIPKTEWIQKVKADDPRYWERETDRMRDQQDLLQNSVATIKQNFNQTEGVHALQRMYGCEHDDDDGTTRGYDQYGYDGEDFISLNLTTGTWTAAKPQAVIFINTWDPRGEKAKYWKDFLQNDCIDKIKKYLSYGRETLERKVRPEASLFQQESSPEVVCHATGFFPKAVMISWKKDGEEVQEDVELRETLPNQDGSFQKRSILRVPAEELQKHTYTCVIQHSSLEKELVLPVSERRILRGGGSGRGSGGGSGGGSDGGSDGAPIGVIVGVVTALVVLVAVVAGIVVWKKKNSGFKPVPAKPGSEGDSSSNNS